MTDISGETAAWQNTDPDQLWVFDKLILARKMGYHAGPAGTDVPEPGYYCVRPCVNALGLGLGASRQWLDNNTDHLPLGSFWCEWFSGRHLSVDYRYGVQTLCAEGTNHSRDLSRWQRWQLTEDRAPLPGILDLFKTRPAVNCEFIGGRLIEVHLRANPDFRWGNTEYIPVWQGESTHAPNGYRFVADPELHNRVGAFVR